MDGPPDVSTLSLSDSPETIRRRDYLTHFPTELRLEILSFLILGYSVDKNGRRPPGFDGSSTSPIPKEAVADLLALSRTCRLLRDDVQHETAKRGLGFVDDGFDDLSSNDIRRDATRIEKLFGDGPNRVSFSVGPGIELDSTLLEFDEETFGREFVDRYSKELSRTYGKDTFQLFGLTRDGEGHELGCWWHSTLHHLQEANLYASRDDWSWTELYSRILIIPMDRRDVLHILMRENGLAYHLDSVFKCLTSIQEIQINLSLAEGWPGRITNDEATVVMEGFQFFPIVACLAALIVTPLKVLKVTFTEVPKITFTGLGPLYDDFMREWAKTLPRTGQTGAGDCGLRRLLYGYPYQKFESWDEVGYREFVTVFEDQLRVHPEDMIEEEEEENLLGWDTWEVVRSDEWKWDEIVDNTLQKFHWEFRR